MSNKKNSLFADAVNNAKELRDTALTNAKLSIAESFSPQIKSMINSKLNEIDELDDEVLDDEVLDDEIQDDEVLDNETGSESDNDELPIEDLAVEEEEMPSDVIDLSIDQLKNVLKDALIEMGIADDMENIGSEEELDITDDIPSEDTLETGEEFNSDDIISIEDDEEEDEDLDSSLDNIIKELFNETEIESLEEEKENLTQELNEAKQKIKELNLLNSKLIYVNRIFKSSNLSESKKISVINSFDKAKSINEVKNIYSILQESKILDSKQTIKENRGFASKALGIKKKEILTENTSDNHIKRMQRLAGIIK